MNSTEVSILGTGHYPTSQNSGYPLFMAVATESSKKRRRKSVAKSRKTGSSWLIGIPILVGILAIPVAVRAASILVLSGPDALTLLFPFVQVVKSTVLKIPSTISNPAAQWFMYLQFPSYGLIMSSLLRTRSFLTAFGGVVFLHGAGILIAYLLLHVQNPYLNLNF